MSERSKMEVAIVPFWAVKLKRLKEEFFRAGAGPEGDMPPIVLAVRGEMVAAVAVAGQVDPELGYKAAQILRVGLDPDILLMAVDAFGKEEETEGPPARLEKGELARRHAAGGADAAGIIQAIMAFEIDRALEITGWRFPYEPRDGALWWDRPEDLSRETVGGILPTVLRSIMSDEKGHAARMSAILDGAAASLKLSPERRLFHQAEAMITHLTDEGYKAKHFIPEPEDDE